MKHIYINVILLEKCPFYALFIYIAVLLKGDIMSKIIMFANQKGGVGKTSSVFETSYILSQRGHRVLMIDLDSQCNLTEICGGESINGKTIYDVLQGLIPVKDAIQNVRENLDILPGSRKMLSQYFVTADDIYLLSDAREFIEENAKNEGREYDYIIIDVGPEGGQLMTMAMIASDYIVAVATLSKLAYSGVVQMCADLQRGKKRHNGFNVEPLGILLNSAKSNTISDINKEKYMELSTEFGALPFGTSITNSCTMDECKEFSLSITEYAPQTSSKKSLAYKIASEYSKIVDEIIDRTKGE